MSRSVSDSISYLKGQRLQSAATALGAGAFGGLALAADSPLLASLYGATAFLNIVTIYIREHGVKRVAAQNDMNRVDLSPVGGR